MCCLWFTYEQEFLIGTKFTGAIKRLSLVSGHPNHSPVGCTLGVGVMCARRIRRGTGLVEDGGKGRRR